MIDELLGLAWSQTWQLTALIVAVAGIAHWQGGRRPHLVHVLWLVVFVKCLTPPVVASPAGVFCHMRSWFAPREIAAESLPGDRRVPVATTATRRASDVNAETASDTHRADELQVTRISAATFGGWEPDDEGEAMVAETSTTGIAGWVAGVWVAGAILILAGAGWRWQSCRRHLRIHAVEQRPDLESRLAVLAKKLNVRRRVRLVITAGRVGPAVVGLARPTILLPSAIVDGKSSVHLDALLAHELIHIRRGDLWMGLVQILAQAAWWFHPLLWLASRLTTRAAEACCDEETIAELGCEPSDYARSLLNVLELKRRLISIPAFPGMKPVDVTRKRLERIMQLGQGCRKKTPWWCWLAMALAASSTLPGGAFVASAENEPKESTYSVRTDAGAAPVAERRSASASDPVSNDGPVLWERNAVGWQVRITRGLQTSGETNDRAANARQRVYINVRPEGAVEREEQSFVVNADRFDLRRLEVDIQLSEIHGEAGAESLAGVELVFSGKVSIALGDFVATAESARIALPFAAESMRTPGQMALVWLHLEGKPRWDDLDGNARWNSERIRARARQIDLNFGGRGKLEMCRLGIFGVKLAGNAQLDGEDIEGAAGEIGVSFISSNYWPAPAGDAVTGKPLQVTLRGDARFSQGEKEGDREIIRGDSIDFNCRSQVVQVERTLRATSGAAPAVAEKRDGSSLMVQKVYPVADVVVPHAPGGVADFGALINLITTSIAPASWDSVGGGGSIHQYSDTLSLVIRQTQAVHHEIAELLGQMRRMADLTVKLRITALRIPAELVRDALPSAGSRMNATLPAAMLTAAQADALRKSANTNPLANVASAPDVILPNGQGFEFSLPLKERSDDKPVQIVPVVNDERRQVHLHVVVGAGSALDALARIRMFTVDDGRPFLVDITEDLDSARFAGLGVGQAAAIRRRFKVALDQRVLLLITPRIVVKEEEEELLDVR
jgi:beta-lactamase regulating signal transducer with metallopeptidase domain